MAWLFTRCPHTGQDIRTQLWMDERTFQAVTLPAFLLTCTACGGEHVWAGVDAWIEPAIASPA